MKFVKFIITFARVCCLFGLSLSAVTYTCPHAEDKDTWHDEGAPPISAEIPCICPYLNALVEKFKDQSDLTMVLGAGDQETDYTDRFKDYTFLVSNENSTVAHRLQTDPTENLIQQNVPFLVPLNFNNKYFFNFLSKLNGKFKKIIFDLSVTKFVTWEFDNVQKIFEALQSDGEFYADIEPRGGGIAVMLSQQGKPVPQYGFPSLAPFDVNLTLETVTFQPEDTGSLFLRCYKLLGIPKNFAIQAPVELDSSTTAMPALNAPSFKYQCEHAKNLLESAGFAQVKIKKNSASPYPLSGRYEMESFDYICAKKRISPEGSSESSKLETLKTSLTHLKKSLVRVSKKLSGLKTISL